MSTCVCLFANSTTFPNLSVWPIFSPDFLWLDLIMITSLFLSFDINIFSSYSSIYISQYLVYEMFKIFCIQEDTHA